MILILKKFVHILYNGDKMNKVNFEKIYYEKEVNNYTRGNFLLNKYNSLPKTEILSHNNIPELRSYKNNDFIKLKKY